MTQSFSHALPELIVRPMQAADLPRVMEIAASLNQAPPWTLEAYRAAIAPQAAVRRAALVAVETSAEPLARPTAGAHGEMRGFAIASFTPPEAELESIGVAPSSQRHGIGSRLFEALAGELCQAGARQIWLEVRASNRAAIGLYRRMGFSETARRRAYYSAPVEDAVLMRLSLG